MRKMFVQHRTRHPQMSRLSFGNTHLSLDGAGQAIRRAVLGAVSTAVVSGLSVAMAVMTVFACLSVASGADTDMNTQADKPDPPAAAADRDAADFFEKHIRPILATHCYECHSEQSQTREGGLLLDRRSGWMQGGDSGAAVVAGDPDGSRLLQAVTQSDPEQRMPPDSRLSDDHIRLLSEWIRRGAPGPLDDMGETRFSKLGDQSSLFAQAADHWAFLPLQDTDPPAVAVRAWNQHAIDRFVSHQLETAGLSPSPAADARTLFIRLSWDLSGLPPTISDTTAFVSAAETNRDEAVNAAVDRLLAGRHFAEHIARMWLDVARYADTDSSYRPDTKTPHYFPFAFSYRDYVIDAFHKDKPFDTFVREQLAADLLYADQVDDSGVPAEFAALGFLTTGPHANRNATDAIDDWIDTTTRGLMGITAACARCHDHKFEPVPTADYYSLHGIFASVNRVDPLNEKDLPVIRNPFAPPSDADIADYRANRAEIDRKIRGAGNSKAKNNNRSVAEKIRETELAELLAFHPGAPVRAMVVRERPQPVRQFVFERGEPSRRGAEVSRHFLTVLDAQPQAFSDANSGRLDLAERIVSPDNPLTARVFVNRVWGLLIGSYLVPTPSDFGLRGARPTHPELLDWLARDFIRHGWSVKHLVRTIVTSRTYGQRSTDREVGAETDVQNVLLWRANRKRLSIENLRDGLLQISGQLNDNFGGRPGPLWSGDYTRRRSVYAHINRFNLDPTLGAFDFPSPMQTQGKRIESVVAPQALFTMNSPFVIDQTLAVTKQPEFVACRNDEQRIQYLFERILLRSAAPAEVSRVQKFAEQQQPLFEKTKRKSAVDNPWPLVAQSLVMSNEFLYVD